MGEESVEELVAVDFSVVDFHLLDFFEFEEIDVFVVEVCGIIMAVNEGFSFEDIFVF